MRIKEVQTGTRFTLITASPAVSNTTGKVSRAFYTLFMLRSESFSLALALFTIIFSPQAE